jgi:hypothetical protein
MFFKRKGHLNFQPQIFSTFFKKDLPGHFDFVFLCPPNQRKVFRSCISMNQNVFKLIEKADRDLADLVHNHPCPHCGGKLHWANYARSPRGLDKKAVRFSLCCAQDGCRRRQTPESIRFLGRKVYPGLIVVLVSALNNGLSPKRVAEVRKTVAVSRATLNRWRKRWLNQFIQTRFWKAARARFMPTISESAIPACLCERFGADQLPSMLNLLRFLGPITTVSQGNNLGFMRVV